MAPASFLGQMPLEVLLLVTGYLTSGLLSLGITVYSLRNRGDNPTVLAFAILTLSSSVWCFGFMGRLLSTSVTSKVVWETVGYLGLVSFPTTLLVFSLYYTGRGNWVTRRTLAFVSAVPAALFVLFATNFLHGMFLSDLSLSTSIGYPLLTATPQEVFWVNVVYNYAVYSLGILVLAYYAVEAPEPYRWQATLMTGGFGLTLVVNVGFLFGLEPFPAADPTPIAIGLMSAVLAVAILRAEFVNILPVARERIVETVNDGVVAVNEEGRVIDVNANAESLLGVENCIGRDVVELLPDEMIESGITDEGSDDQAEVKLERADGRTRWIWMRRFPLSDRGGWILILTDITTRKTRERQLSRKNERLDRIAGVISHDLRNPMDVIKKRGKLARKRGAEEDFDSIERSVERMDTLIEDMLQLARQGKDIDEREEVDIDSLAESAWHTVETRDAELSASSDIVASGDEGRLRQAFENLFRNSVEHAGDDVEIEVGRLEEKEGFYVEDDGPGIPPENLDEVFDYGWTDSKSGSGFGLAIVRDVVEAHGWKIEAVECERGARFEVFDVDSNPTSR